MALMNSLGGGVVLHQRERDLSNSSEEAMPISFRELSRPTKSERQKEIEKELNLCPMTEIVFSINSPGMDPKYMKSSMELFAAEVIPHFRKR
jgi:hypothetical protein